MRTETVALTAGDGLPLKLRRVQGERDPFRGPVLLVHGAGNRGESFRPPARTTTIVDLLLAEGWDVWLFDWRASKSIGLVGWTLDQAAQFDHPAAVHTVLSRTGASDMKIIAHCVGSASVIMSAVTGQLPGVSTIIGNAFGLHPCLPWRATAKLRRLVPLIGALTRDVSPAWGDRPEGILAHLMRLLVRATNRECRNDVCRMASFIFGGGPSPLWNHRHLDEATHDWLRGEFGPVPLSFFRQMARSTAAGQIVPDDDMTNKYVRAPKTDTRFVFLSGANNRCFLPESQQRTFAHFERHQPGRHQLHVFPGYGHLDVFIGKNAANDTFPTILSELEK
jgi:hypothetical protein